GFDPDLWNANDKQNQVEAFVGDFNEHGSEIVRIYRTRGFVTTPESFTRLVNRCAQYCVRTDIIPLSFDLTLYHEEGWSNGVASPFKRSEKSVDTIFNLVALGLMEKFDVVAWYPKPHVEGDASWSARATCSFAVLTSLGMDFMRACIRA